ncbi:MAG: VOC family protein [Planctomycetota bacterium]
MYEDPTLSLIVLRVSNIERAAEVYSTIGFTFKREQHGSGPEHFSTWVGDTVFELYPTSERFPATTSRVGFAVTSIVAVVNNWRQTGCEVLSEPKESPYGLRAVVVDPDGHHVELTQKTELSSVPQKILEVFSEDSNYAVIKPPGRQYPGAVIQGDSLSILCHTAKQIAEAVRDGRTDQEDFVYNVEELLHSLVGRLHHYQSVLDEHGQELPFSNRVTEDDYIKLTPEDDDEP